MMNLNPTPRCNRQDAARSFIRPAALGVFAIFFLVAAFPSRGLSFIEQKKN